MSLDQNTELSLGQSVTASSRRVFGRRRFLQGAVLTAAELAILSACGQVPSSPVAPTRPAESKPMAAAKPTEVDGSHKVTEPISENDLDLFNQMIRAIILGQYTGVTRMQVTEPTYYSQRTSVFDPSVTESDWIRGSFFKTTIGTTKHIFTPVAYSEFYDAKYALASGFEIGVRGYELITVGDIVESFRVGGSLPALITGSELLAMFGPSVASLNKSIVSPRGADLNGDVIDEYGQGRIPGRYDYRFNNGDFTVNYHRLPAAVQD